MNETFSNQFKVSGSVGFNAGLNAVRKREWIVGSISEAGIFSVSASPVFHDSDAKAQTEAVRLAKLNPGTTYVVLRLTAGKLVPRIIGVAEF